MAQNFHQPTSNEITAPMSLRILQVLAPPRVGGSNSAVLGLVAGLQRADCSVAAVVLAGPDAGPFLKRLEALGIPFDVVHSPGRNYLRDLRGIRRSIHSWRPNVLHTHGYRADMLGLMAAHGAQTPSVATAHGFTFGGWRNRLYERLQVVALRRHDAVIAVSKPLAEDLARRGVPQERLVICRNAWSPPTAQVPTRGEARAILGLPLERQVIGWVGRLAWVKAPAVALESFAASANGDAILSFVGDGPDRPALETAAKRLGLAERVRFHGLVPDAWRVLKAFDAVLLSSHSEGTPMILLEAMHAGVPIVSTAVGGVPDLLDDRSAWLVPSGDSGRLGVAIAEALRDRGAADVRAAAARVRLETDFAPERWVAQHMDLYRRLTGRTD